MHPQAGDVNKCTQRRSSGLRSQRSALSRSMIRQARINSTLASLAPKAAGSLIQPKLLPASRGTYSGPYSGIKRYCPIRRDVDRRSLERPSVNPGTQRRLLKISGNSAGRTRSASKCANKRILNPPYEIYKIRRANHERTSKRRLPDIIPEAITGLNYNRSRFVTLCEHSLGLSGFLRVP